MQEDNSLLVVKGKEVHIAIFHYLLFIISIYRTVNMTQELEKYFTLSWVFIFFADVIKVKGSSNDHFRSLIYRLIEQYNGKKYE